MVAISPAHAQAPDQFYAGRTINLIVPSNPGGAYDISARLVGRHLGRHIPGQPSVVVQNQSGGAAGIVLANRLGNTPETNGTLIDMSAILAGQKELWNSGKLKVVIQFARTKPLLPQLPDAAIGRDLLTDPKDRALVEFAELPFFMGFPFVAPAGTEPARLTALRKGFDAMVADAGFKDDAAKIGFPLSPIDAAAVKKLVEQTAATPKDVVERFKKLLE